MNFKKTIAKSLVVAMALGMVPVANLQTAKAAGLGDIKFVGSTGTATSENATYWGLAKVDAKAGKGSVKIGDKSYKISNIQEYVGEIDVYAALKGKAGVIVTGDTATPTDKWKVFEIPAAETTFKVQIVASPKAAKGVAEADKAKVLGGDYGYVAATVGKTPKAVDMSASSEAIEVKVGEGNWQTLKAYFGNTIDNTNVTNKLKVLSQGGSSLAFRIAGTATSWPSKEVKVKAVSNAKGPSVKVDISKDTTSIKKGMEWQMDNTGKVKPEGTWKKYDGKALPVADLGLDATKNSMLFVRTAATDRKLASKVTTITLNKPATALKIDGNKIEATGAAIKDNAGTNTLAVLESNVPYDITKGVTLTNLTATPLEYALVTTADKALKWNTLKATPANAKKPSVAKLKYSATAKANTWGSDGSKFFVRLGGVKQDTNGVVTLSGVSAGAVIAVKNIAQKFVLIKDDKIVKAENTTKAAIEVATATALDVTFKGKIEKIVKTGVAPKVKLVDGPKVRLKAEKIAADGTFEIKVSIPKTLFKDKVEGKAKIDLSIEGVKDGFTIEFTKKTN